MRSVVKIAGVMAVLVLATAPSATATAGPFMFGGRTTFGPFSTTASTVGGTGSNFPAHVFTLAAGATVTCAAENADIFSITVPQTASEGFVPAFSGCVFAVSGTSVGFASVDVNCEWTLTFTHATFGSATGASPGGTLTAPCQTTFTVPTVGCTVHLGAIANKGSLWMQSVTSAGTSTASASPWGSTVSQSISGLSYTTTTTGGGNCVIPASGANVSYDGGFYIKNLWGRL